MRGAIHFVAIVVISVALVVGAAFLAGVSPIVASLAFVGGIAVTIAASIYVNTRNANLYGRRTYEDVYFREESDMYWQEPVHADGMRRDRVRRHAEAPVTFPAGEPL